MLSLREKLRTICLRSVHVLGSSCGETAECDAFTDDGVERRLCCQDVHRGRQGTKRMCDRVTPISVCLVDSAVLRDELRHIQLPDSPPD